MRHYTCVELKTRQKVALSCRSKPCHENSSRPGGTSGSSGGRRVSSLPHRTTCEDHSQRTAGRKQRPSPKRGKATEGIKSARRKKRAESPFNMRCVPPALAYMPAHEQLRLFRAKQ